MNKRHMNFQVLGRLLRYVLKHYKFSCLVVLVFIILSSVANVSVSLFIRVLIDDYITPLSQSPSPDFSSLLRVLLQMLCVFGMGVFANFAYQRILVNVGQGTLRNTAGPSGVWTTTSSHCSCGPPTGTTRRPRGSSCS